MIKTKTVVVRVGAMQTGHVEIHIEKQFVGSKGEIVGYPDLRYHVLTAEVGTDMDGAMKAVNEDLVEMGTSPIDSAEIKKIKALCATHWSHYKSAK